MKHTSILPEKYLGFRLKWDDSYSPVETSEINLSLQDEHIRIKKCAFEFKFAQGAPDFMKNERSFLFLVNSSKNPESVFQSLIQRKGPIFTADDPGYTMPLSGNSKVTDELYGAPTPGWKDDAGVAWPTYEGLPMKYIGCGYFLDAGGGDDVYLFKATKIANGCVWAIVCQRHTEQTASEHYELENVISSKEEKL